MSICRDCMHFKKDSLTHTMGFCYNEKVYPKGKEQTWRTIDTPPDLTNCFEERLEPLRHQNRLDALCSQWDFSPVTIRKVFIEMGESFDETEEYLDFMDAVAQSEDPADAWEDWCIDQCIAWEADNNPFRENTDDV